MASYQTTSELSHLLYDTKSCEIPKNFVFPERYRPAIGVPPSSQLPVIDLARGLNFRASDSEQGDRNGVIKELMEACTEWGFCQVVNHGVSKELIKTMLSMSHEFFALPTERKMRGLLPFLQGYDATARPYKGIGTCWLEGVTFQITPTSTVEAFTEKIWPEGNAIFCDTIHELGKELETLKNEVLNLLAEGLGLQTNFFSKHFHDPKKVRGTLRVNYYPACPQPSMTLGATPHTDPALMSILYQDRGNGLQIRGKDGNWHLVEYKEDGLILFVADVLQAWSNGILPAGIHRAILSETDNRLSFVLLSAPPKDLSIEPAPYLVDQDGGARYKPFKYGDYWNKISEYAYFPLEGGFRGMDAFAGINPKKFN